MSVAPEEAIWHDVECGEYVADLAIWEELARAAAGPVLELGAGTGRVALHLARDGFEVFAVDRAPALLAELQRRAADQGLEVGTACADVRELSLGRRFPLVCAPMQLAHLLGGRDGRAAFLRTAAVHLNAGGALAIAILAATIDPALHGDPPLPDVGERDGWVYSSQPLEAVRVADGIEVRRLRQRVSPDGELSEAVDVVLLDALDAGELEAEALDHGLVPGERIEIPPTRDHVGSTIVVLEVGP